MEFKIEKDIYSRMLGVCPVPPETGGIIGGKDRCISRIVVEETRGNYEYTPNVGFLNQIIAEWSSQGISFYGIFHSHPNYCDKLSRTDVDYIKDIMMAMPSQITMLMFPLVLPGDKIIPYIAKRIEDNVVIEQGKWTLASSHCSEQE